MSGARALARRLAAERGYSLVELIAVMAILTTVLGTLTSLFVAGTRSQLDLSDRVQAQNGAVVALARLRRDVHCAISATSVSGSAVTLSTACPSGGTVSWCVTTTAPGRFVLRRHAGAGSCTTADPPFADYLTSSAVFAYQDSATAATRAKLKATLVVRAPKMVQPYALCDVLVLRNSLPAGAATVAPC